MFCGLRIKRCSNACFYQRIPNSGVYLELSGLQEQLNTNKKRPVEQKTKSTFSAADVHIKNTHPAK